MSSENVTRDTSLSASFTGKPISRKNVVPRLQPKTTPCKARGVGSLECILDKSHQLSNTNHVSRVDGKLVSWRSK